MAIQRFEDSECWQQSRILVNLVHDSINSSDEFKKEYRLSGQVAGAAISIMKNMAEGWASQSNAEFIRFLIYSRRSAAEIQNCAYIAADQKYITKELFDEICNQ